MASADCHGTRSRGARAGLAAFLLAGALGCGDAPSNATPQPSATPGASLAKDRPPLSTFTLLNWRTPLFEPPSPAAPPAKIAAPPAEIAPPPSPPVVAATDEPQLAQLPPVEGPTESTVEAAPAAETALAVVPTPSPRELPEELPVSDQPCEPETLVALPALEAAEKPDLGGDAVPGFVEASAAQPTIEAAVESSAAPPVATPTIEVVEMAEVAKVEPAPPAPPPIDEQDRVARSAAETAPSVTGVPTGAMVNERAQARIRRGYALAQRGANFAARSAFLEALQMIAEAKDQIHGAPRRTIALADGLRALDEAADFLPRSAESDADLGVDVIVAAHRTPVGKTPDAARLMPQKLAALYFRFAQVQLGAAVAGEPAGSMALHGLGKLYSQLGRVEPAKHPQAERRAFALQQAALVARGDNHLAAHELGVLLAEAGHLPEAEQVFSQVCAREPHPVVLRNLARVQRKLGREQMAAASERQAILLAERAVSAEPVRWVTPETLARTGDSLAPPMPTAQSQSPPRPQPAPAQMPTIQNARRQAPGYQR